MKKIIPFVFISCILCVLVIIFKTNKREPIVEPIALDNAAHMKVDLKTLEKVHQNSVFLPQSVRKKIAVKQIQKQSEKIETEASVQMEQELLWQEDDITQKDEKDKSSFSHWVRQKLSGVKMKLKLPF